MFKNNKILIEDLNNLLNRNVKPYVFRTRLERTLERAKHLSIEQSNKELQSKCDKLLDKLNYISDHSNQTSDGSTKSYLYLKEDIIDLYKLVI